MRVLLVLTVFLTASCGSRLERRVSILESKVQALENGRNSIKVRLPFEVPQVRKRDRPRGGRVRSR